MRYLTRLFAVSLLLLFAAVYSAPARAADTTVEAVDGNEFSPATVTIQVGDTVTWTNSDDIPHTSTSNDGVWDSGNLDPGDSYSFTFTEAGTYDYVCVYHEGMTGTVVVEAAAGGDDDGTDDQGTGDTGGDDDQQAGDDDQQGGDDDQTPSMPDTGVGGMVGAGAASLFAALATTIVALTAGAFALLRRS